MTSLGYAHRRAAASAWAAAFALVAGSLAAPANATGSKPGTLTSDQLAQVQQQCETTLHLKPGETHFDGCVAGLSDSLADVSRVEAVQSAREACFQILSPGAPELGECLLNAAEGPGSSATAISSKSYFRASRDDIRRDEKLSCARLGFDPMGGAFETCVANLSGALDAVDRPPEQ